MHRYPVKLSLRLDWSEMDMFGHINNVSFSKYIQASRVNYWETISLTEFHKKQNIAPMLASTSIQFKKPLFYPGNIIVESRMDFIKNSSFSIHHRILDDKGIVAAEAQDVMVWFDFNTHRKVNFPDTLRKKVEQIESSL